jgi:hypothetical protein
MIRVNNPRSLDEKKNLTRRATKIARLVPLALLFVSASDELGVSREGKPPRPPAAPHYCSLHGSDH